MDAPGANDARSPTSPTGANDMVTANYNKLSDHIRRLTPQGIQCSVFCGGTNCKYENPENWTADNLALHGLYSNWITDNILAMARPSTVLIIQKNIIEQFHSLGIKSIINLQCPKEHASCGQPLEDTGFSYDPNIFMENNIYYYNFTWKDYGDASLVGLLNMVKVVAFAATEGRVAIHCHAGLGRTGVLIACYLIYSLRVPANAAIKYVRLKRPGSVQTRGQIMCVRQFANHVLPNLVTFYIKEQSTKDKHMHEFTLQRFIKRQKIALHGYEERNYKYLPKIVHRLCERILKLTGCNIEDLPQSNIPYTTDFLCTKMGPGVTRHESIYSFNSHLEDLHFLSPTSIHSPSSSNSDIMSLSSAPPSPNPESESSDVLDSFSELDDESTQDLIENKCFHALELHKTFEDEKASHQTTHIVYDIGEVVDTLIIADMHLLPYERKKKVRQLEEQINGSKIGWLKLESLHDVGILAAMLFDWLESLKKPVLDRENLEKIVIHYKQPEICLTKIEESASFLLEYLLLFVSKLQISNESLNEALLKRLLAALTQQYVVIRDIGIPSGRGFKKLRDGTMHCTLEFMNCLQTSIDLHHRQLKSSPRFEFGGSYNDDDDSDVENGFHD
ncbi:protein tyrosine phosphatase domain-containing protein 1-like isoform X2 [Atheta coriaria]|uniref:protein tyrosine phosphatase domain-containing protein 1-like isoform X2 n=1 Tax=Dalotia coriaria TaxID=877792 RepID=UPI0031F347CA